MADTFLDFATRVGELIKSRALASHALMSAVSLLGERDLDGVTSQGIYLQHLSGNATTARHYPPGEARGYLIVLRDPSQAQIVAHLYFGAFTRKLSIREQYSGVWGDWVQAGGIPTDMATQTWVRSNVATLGMSLGSAHLDTVTASGWRPQTDSTLATPANGYPAGAGRGELLTVLHGTQTGYRLYLSPIVGKSWMQERSSGTWGTWIALGGGSAPATPADVTVQAGNRVFYGAERPDAWASPATTYWHHPDGTTVIPPTYRGDGYVGKLAAATGYSQMLVTKAETSGTVDVSCINPTTGRHVTYRLQGPWSGAANGMDAFQRIEETWIGAVTNGKPTADTLVMPRSNIEWAFQIDVGGNRQFVPHHGSVTAVDAGAPRGLYRMDGTAIDLSTLAVGGTIAGLNGVKHRQSVYARHPDSGTTNWVRIDQVITISPDGMLQSESTWTALRDVVVGSHYAPMTPIQVGLVDAAHVLGGGTYPIPTTSPATTTYDTIAEGKAAESVLFSGPSVFAAVAFLDPAETLLRGDPLGETTTPVRIENRSSGLVKLYPSAFRGGVTVPAGTVWRAGAQWRYGETSNPGQFG